MAEPAIRAGGRSGAIEFRDINLEPDALTRFGVGIEASGDASMVSTRTVGSAPTVRSRSRDARPAMSG
jgi:hypothetical protein